MGAEGVAGLEDRSHAGMLLEHQAEPMGEGLELLGPVQGGVEVDVDLGQDAVKEQVLEPLFVADVVVEGAGDDPQAGGQAAHGQGFDAVLGDDCQRLCDHPLAGEPGTAVLVVGGRVEPQRACGPVARSCAGGCGCPLVPRCLGSLGHAPPLICSGFLNGDLDT